MLSRPVDGALRLLLRPEQMLLDVDPTGVSQLVWRGFYGHDQPHRVQRGEYRLLVISGSTKALDVETWVRLRVCDCVAQLVEQAHAHTNGIIY